MLSPHRDKVFPGVRSGQAHISSTYMTPRYLMSRQPDGYSFHSLVDLLCAEFSSRCRGYNSGGAITAQCGRRIETEMNR